MATTRPIRFSSWMMSGALACALPLCSLVAHAAQSADAVSPKVQELYREAVGARQRGDSAEAIEKYREMIRLAPHLAAAYNNLGMLYFNDHDYAHAADVLKRGLDINPAMPGAEAMLGMSYFQLGDDDKAEPLLEKANRAAPADDQIEMVLVKTLMNRGRLREAAVHLNKFLARNPKDQQGWYLLGKAYLQLSENALKKIDEIDPNSVVAHEISGEIDESMHNYDLALVEYKKAIDMAPNQPGTYMHMGDAYWSIGKWRSAQEEFRAELKNDPNNCIARWKLADATLEANDSSQDALTELNAVLDRCPALMQAHVDRARALIRLGRQVEALPDLQLAVKDSPREPSVHFLLAAVYRAQGDGAAALKEMRIYSDLQKQAAATTAAQAQDATAIKNSAQ